MNINCDTTKITVTPILPNEIISPCFHNPAAGFTYITLRTKETVTTILGENTHADTVFLFDIFGLCPSLFSRTISIPLLIKTSFDNKISHNSGYVISSEDFETNGITSYITRVDDADGVFQVLNSSNIFIDMPTSFILDRGRKRIVAVANNNDVVLYGDQTGQRQFSDPFAVTAVGKFIYILDRGTKNTIEILNFGLDGSGKLTINAVDSTNFGIDVSSASDITSFENTNEHVLYIANPAQPSISRIILDKSTGLQKTGVHAPYTITSAKNSKGIDVPIGSGGGMFIESSPRSSASGRNMLLVSHSNYQLLALTTDALAATPTADVNFYYIFPEGGALNNIGYNLGNSSFYVADYH